MRDFFVGKLDNGHGVVTRDCPFIQNWLYLFSHVQ